MKIGIISDIHSNALAFKACMEYLEKNGCEEYFFLGDYVSDTPYTRETMGYLWQIKEKYTCHFIRGNREGYMLNQRANPIWLKNSASGNLLFTYEQLSKKDLDFMAELPISMIFEKEGFPAITICHGSPSNDRELMQVEGENTKVWLDKISTDYLIAAHTHNPGMFSHRGRTYINPGCSGIAIKDVGFAQCMILEYTAGKWVPDFIKVPYDYRRVVRDIFATGMYDYAPWFMNNNIHILLTGIDKTPEMVELAGHLQELKTGEKAVWPYIEECYFEQAAGKLGIKDYK